jgi:hypothetical protein
MELPSKQTNDSLHSYSFETQRHECATPEESAIFGCQGFEHWFKLQWKKKVEVKSLIHSMWWLGGTFMTLSNIYTKSFFLFLRLLQKPTSSAIKKLIFLTSFIRRKTMELLSKQNVLTMIE